jgi:hypothetical protein
MEINRRSLPVEETNNIRGEFNLTQEHFSSGNSNGIFVVSLGNNPLKCRTLRLFANMKASLNLDDILIGRVRITISDRQ